MSRLNQYLEKAKQDDTCVMCKNFEMEVVGPYDDDPKRPKCDKKDRYIDDWSSEPEIPEWCPGKEEY